MAGEIMSGNAANTRDEDAGKGAVEQDRPGEKTNVSRRWTNRTP